MQPGDEPPDIFEELRSRIADTKRSSADLERAADLPAGSVSRFLRGDRLLSAKNLRKLCRELRLHFANWRRRRDLEAE